MESDELRRFLPEIEPLGFAAIMQEVGNALWRLQQLEEAVQQYLVVVCAFSIRWHPFSLNSVTPEGLSVSFVLPRDQRSRPPEATGGCSGCSIDMRCRSYGAPA